MWSYLEDDIQTADIRCCGEHQSKAVVWQVAVGRGACFSSSGRIKKPSMTSLSVDHHGMAVVSSGVAVKSFKKCCIVKCVGSV